MAPINEDDPNRPRRPIPRVKPNQRNGPAGSTSPTNTRSTSLKDSTRTHPVNTQGSLAGLTTMPGATPGGPPGQWFPANSNGGMSAYQQTQRGGYPVNPSDVGAMTDGSGMMGNFFAQGYPSLSLSPNSASTSSLHHQGSSQSQSPPTPLDGPHQPHSQSTQVWDGIFAQQPFNNAAPGIPSTSFFTPFLGYQGGGGSMGFAAEAQAFLENDEVSAAWGAGLNVE